MYNDLYLKFKDEAEANAVLFTEQTYLEEEETKTYKIPKYTAIDVIGTIYKPTGVVLVTDEGGVPEMAPIEGWHVNVRHKSEMPELEEYAVEVQTPSRIWA